MKVSGKKIAAMLELSPSTVRGYAQKGLIPFEVTPGGHRRYEPDAVREALRERQPRFAPLEPGEDSRLSSANEASSDFEMAPRWRPAITTSMVREDAAQTPPRGPLRVPVIGVPGSSQFAVEQGARA